ncbi:MAG TPA: PAS domain-containing protein [Sphingomicrobium sp.]|nr:PAS domain-containing protein [Sphingomicrobium sp.]
MATDRDEKAVVTIGEPPADSNGPGFPVDVPAEFFTAGGMQTLADLMPVMIAYADRTFTYRFLNKAMAEWFEKPRSAILGKTMREVLGEDGWAHRRPLLEGVLAGERQLFVAEMQHDSRGTVAVQVHYVPWRGPGGAVDGVVVLVDDVTEQKVAERALRESEARFKRIANSAPVMMWVTRLDRVRDFVNDHYVEFVAGPDGDREAVRTIDWRSRIHPDDEQRIVAESIAGEAAGDVFTLEGRYLRHDGEYRWLRSVSQPRFGPDGEHIGFIGVATDITAEKEAELELRRQVEDRTAELGASEAQFRAVFEAALEVMVLLKPDGTVIAVNHRKEAWRYDDPDESIGVKLWDAPTLGAYPQHIDLIKRGVKQAARGEMFTTQAAMERPGAPTAHLDVAIQPVRDGAGKIIYLLFEARDITELKAAQEQLRQAQKMEALGQLTGGIAHDFNNLLTVVVGGLDVVSQRVEDAKLKRYAINALTAAERGARLTGQLLAFSRVQRLEVRPVHVAPLIQNMRPLLRNVLGPGIAKQFELDEDMMPVIADPTQLEVAVLNLAINARDAMPEGGVLRFTSRSIAVEDDPELEPGNYIELTISDTGTGMDEEVAGRAFEPFFTTKDIGKGTGLGLSMVYGMARQSGGTARIETAPGKGTAVKLYFRAADSDALCDTDEQSGEAGRRRAATASILVIDDDPDVRAFIAEALSDEGYQVRDCSDGKCGLAEFEADPPDLVVLDFVMPEMPGSEVARQMLERRPDQKILFVSGYSETDAIKAVAPDSPVLAKPFRSVALSRAIRDALA